MRFWILTLGLGVGLWFLLGIGLYAQKTAPVLNARLLSSGEQLKPSTIVGLYDMIMLELFDSLTIDAPYGPEYRFFNVEVTAKLGLGVGNKVMRFGSSNTGRNAVMSISLAELIPEGCTGGGRIYIVVEEIEELNDAGEKRKIKLPDKYRNFQCALTCES
jgi:hypothetical protein